MDQGIIACVKRAILNRKVRFALQCICSGVKSPYQVGLLRAVTWCEQAWDSVTETTIRNCWKHAGQA